MWPAGCIWPRGHYLLTRELEEGFRTKIIKTYRCCPACLEMAVQFLELFLQVGWEIVLFSHQQLSPAGPKKHIYWCYYHRSVIVKQSENNGLRTDLKNRACEQKQWKQQHGLPAEKTKLKWKNLGFRSRKLKLPLNVWASSKHLEWNVHWIMVSENYISERFS